MIIKMTQLSQLDNNLSLGLVFKIILVGMIHIFVFWLFVRIINDKNK